MGKWRYGVILDAGSSGTRVHIYRWLKYDAAHVSASTEDLHKLPAIKTKKKWTLKEHPGVSSYSDKLDLIGPEHLEPLFKHALDVVPKHEVKDTPIFLLATAGVRMLPPEEVTAMMREICAYARKTTDFQLPDCALHIQAISGETEGLYGWIAANYLLGGFDDPSKHDHGKGHHTYGFLDMGGASAQIAYAPNSTVAETDKDSLNLLRLRTLEGNSVEYKVFVTTWLRFGVRESRKRYVEGLLEEHGPIVNQELPDPCLPKGLQLSLSGDMLMPDNETNNLHLYGTGKFLECVDKTTPLLGHEKPCDNPPCPMNGIHIPPIDFDINHFVGVSEYWHTTHEIFEMGHKDKAYDYKTYQDRVVNFCSKTWDEIEEGLKKEEWGHKVDEAKAAEVCFKASWLINVLHNGFGIPRVGIESTPTGSDNTTKEIIDNAGQEGYLAPFQAVNKIDSTELSWTLGKMVLYASSQVPPTNTDVLPVGFGSNIESGIPADFQHAGGRPDLPLPTDSIAFTGDDDDDSDDSDLSDSDDEDLPKSVLSNSNMGKRAPGFLLFLVIFIVVALLLCGRERRQNLFRKCNPFSKQRNRFSRQSPRSGLFGFGKRRAGKYEAVEGTDEIPNPGEFELASYSDSSSSDDLEKGIRRTSTQSSRHSNSSGSSSTSSSLRRTQGGRSVISRGSPALGLGLHGGLFNQPSVATGGVGMGSGNGNKERLDHASTDRTNDGSRKGSPARQSKEYVD